MYRLGRRPGLDGIRALAIAVVFLSHVQWHVPGGYYGVDVFFVLSGFLITTLLLQEHGKTGRIALGAFYARRTRRLLPALVCVLVLVAVIFTVSFHGQLWASEFAVIVYLGNWFEAFGHRLAGGLLVQTWSLGIEEQFYALWPILLLVGLSRGWSSRKLLLVALIPAIGSYALRTVLWGPGAPGGPENAFPYFSSFTRADSILLGCALAIAISDEQLRERLAFLKRPALAGAALAAIVAAALIDGNANPLVWAMVDIASVIVVGHIALVGSSPVTRLLSTKPLVWIGARSYGIYLYHYPIIIWTLATFHPMATAPGLVQTVFFAGVTALVAEISYRFVEVPLQRSSGRGRARRRRRAPVRVAEAKA